MRGRCVVQVRCSTQRDGDFHIDIDRSVLEHRRQAFAPGSWTQLDEVHGTRVVRVAAPGEHDLVVGDAAVTSCRGAVLAVWVGDCAPVVLVGDDGSVGVAHAGWRGALDGVLQAAVGAMVDIGASSVDAVLGPCIHPCCYEFGVADLHAMAERFGSEVVATTTWGTPSLSMPAVVGAALAEVGVAVAEVEGGSMSACTRCTADTYFSHRRGEKGRQVMTVSSMAEG